jgi:hypothetical protein
LRDRFRLRHKIEERILVLGYQEIIDSLFLAIVTSWQFDGVNFSGAHRSNCLSQASHCSSSIPARFNLFVIIEDDVNLATNPFNCRQIINQIIGALLLPAPDTGYANGGKPQLR